MGEILGIRVMAQTWNEDEVAKAWPWLCSLVWPDWANRLGVVPPEFARATGIGPHGAPGVVEKALGAAKHGVVELATALDDMVRVGDIPDAVRKILAGPVKTVASANSALADALGNWETQKAMKLTDELEKAITGAEKALADMPNA